MTLSPDVLKQGMVSELEAFGKLVAGLSDEERNAPSRCEGWSAGDVAAHVVATITYIVTGRLSELADPDHTQRQVDERAGKSAGELADELTEHMPAARAMLDAFPPESWDQTVGDGFEGTLAEGIEALWYDAYIHADDVRHAVGRPTERGDGLACALEHVVSNLEARKWGPATLALDGFDEIEISGGGDRVTGDAHEFVLAATGRLDPSSFGLDATVNIYADG